MARQISTPIAVSVQGLTKAISQLNALDKGVGKIAKTAGLAGIGIAAFMAGVKAADFAVQAVAGARDLERNLAGLKTVFEDVTPQMTAFSKNAVNMGLSLNEASKSSIFIGSVLKQSGFDIQQTADLTERLVGLATDLSLTYGYDVQEALLGMTALFRGEYDPIEKFGVAMKQSEINSELAARSMGHLEGAQRRFAEQQIRVQLLFERSADAQGAMARQSGTLAVEQVKLAATFANVKDTVATSLLPVITELMQSLRGVMEDVQPRLKQVFDDLAPVIETVGQALIPKMVEGFFALIDVIEQVIKLMDDFTNPTTELGESWTALNIQVESLFKTITGNQLTIEGIFGILSGLLGIVVDLIHDILYVIENTIIGFQVMGEMAAAFFTGDWDKLVNTSWDKQIRQQIELKDALNASKLEMAGLYEAARRSLDALGDQTEIWNKPSGKTDVGIANTLTGGSEASGTAAKNYVKEFFDKLEEEVAKESARAKLSGMGASEGLINSILGSQGWEQVIAKILAGGKKQLAGLQKDFNKTKAGIDEINQAQEEAKRLADEQAEAAQKAADKLAEQQQAYEELLASLKEFNDSVKDVVILSILPTIAREVGQFEAEVISAFDNIKDSLKGALDNGQIYQGAYNQLIAYAEAERVALEKIARQRDELATKYDWVENLLKQYRDAFTGSLKLTSLLSSLEAKTKDVTVTEVTEGIGRLDGSLKEFSKTVTRTYKESITETIDSAGSLVQHFQDIADKAKAFGNNLKELHRLGLDPQLFNQLVEAGVEAGGETAQALIDGGEETITEINKLFKEIADTGVAVGEYVANDFYATGESFASQLLAGIRSQQSAFEETAKTLAKTFQDNFNVKVGNATQQVADVANYTDQITALTDKQTFAAKRLGEEQAKLASGTLGPKAREAANTKISSYSSQIADFAKQIADLTSKIENTKVAPLASGGIALGSALAMIGEGGPEAVIPLDKLSGMMSANQGNNATNITINVTANNRAGGIAAGEAIIGALKSYAQAGGPVGNLLGQAQVTL